MDELRSLLAWNAKVTDPLFMGLVAVFMIGLTLLIIERPRLYLPLILITAPFPKLFTISNYTNGASMDSAPGFSVVDMVLAAGIAALLLRRWKYFKLPESRRFASAMRLWMGSVAFSVFVGVTVWSGTYRTINSVYALRYLLTLISFGLGAQYGWLETDDASLRRMLHRLAYAGNITIALGLIYYFEFGSSGGGAKGVNLFDTTGSAVYRSYMWFFDYGIDMGYFVATIGVLNVILLADRRLLGLRLLNAAGLLGCVAAVLLLGERVNVLVLGVAIAYFLWETSAVKHRSVRISIMFQLMCVTAVVIAFVATMTIVAPEFIAQKFANSVGQNTATQDYGLYVMKSTGVPESLATTVAAFPFGDFAARLSLNVAGLWFFFANPEGAGFWGQLDAAGFWSHHEIVTIAIEQGVFGLAALTLFLARLRRLLWSGRHLPGGAGQLGVLLRATSAGLLASMILANTVLIDLKYMMVYWTLVGVWSVVPRNIQPAAPAMAATTQSQRVPVSV